MRFLTTTRDCRYALDFLDLKKIQNHRGLATKERNQYGHFIAIHINIAYRTDEIGERAIYHTHTLAFRETNLGLWLLSFLCNLFQNGLDFMLHEGNRFRPRANKARNTRRVTYDIPGFVAHDHLDQHIA